MSYNMRGREPRPNRLEVRLTHAELERLNQACQRVDRTASAVVRLAIAEYVGRIDNDAPPIESSLYESRTSGDD